MLLLYKGPSVLDQDTTIVVLATFGTSNRKTGDMVQVWILLEDTAPHHAVKLGTDTAICGNCSHRHHTGGACYVLPFQAPLAVWTAYQNGNYEEYQPGDLEGLAVRFGAYGDPAAIPYAEIEPILEECDLDGSTGYTHQLAHKNWDWRTTLYCHVSADTPRQAIKAQSLGYKTFRVAGDADKRLADEIECLADSAGISCADCRLCNGQNANIVIAAHGARTKTVKFHDVIARG